MYYVAHRLFALHDRALGALVASELAGLVGSERVFLPFCDTDEDALVSECKGRILFELDSERLQALTGMIAILHGPSLDDGVCMEIGYARRLGVPVVVLTTDFQTYSTHEDGPALEFPDPLVDAVATEIIRVPSLSRPVRRADADRFRIFLDRNVTPLRAAARSAADQLLAHGSRDRADRAPPEPTVRCRAFIEPSPYRRLESWEPIADLLDSHGWEVHAACRWGTPPEASQAETLSRARRDWDAHDRASLLIADVNGPEAPPGAALLIGASTAAGRPVFAAYEDRSFTFAPGREVNFRNLMIQYAIAERFRSLNDLAKLLDRR